MPPPKGPIWAHFIAVSPDGEVVELDDTGKPAISSESWVKQACKEDVGGVRGVRDSMIAHILGKSGSNPCPNASVAARKTAKMLKGKGKKREYMASDTDTEEKPNQPPPKKKLLTNVLALMQQSHLKVFQGPRLPFTPEQVGIVHEQFLRATVSANLPFRWVDDPEVIKLFLLFRSTAGDVILSRQQISGVLLDKADAGVSKRLRNFLQGKYAVLASDGWKDDSHNAINGVNLSVEGKVSIEPFVEVI
ncbi:hypothetical protein C0992_003918 [Termitomyces sp. T32_za158]|nr:hypothetical protein C0992_003918 [Termitomyces sp. T32_za158]